MKTILPTQQLPHSKKSILTQSCAFLASSFCVSYIGLSIFSPQIVKAQTNAVRSPINVEQPQLVVPINTSQPQMIITEEQIVSANSVSLTAIPPRMGDDFDLQFKPGETYQLVIRVRNSSNQALSIESSIKDFLVDSDGSTPVPLEEDAPNRWSMAAWTTISPKQQVLPPNSTSNVNVVVKVPNDALPGGHYAVILHQPVFDTSANSGSQTGIGQRVGTLLYGIVDGPINEAALIRDINFPKFTEYGPIDFSLHVENLSDIHIKPRLSLEIYNWWGKQVDTIQLEDKNIFPYTSREFSNTWQRRWGIGLYRVKALMSYGTGGQIAVANTSFWLLPLTIVIVSATGIIALIIVLLLVWRTMRRKMSHDKRRVSELERKLQELKSRQ